MLDLVFSNDDIIDCIVVRDTFISDHCLLSVTTCIPTIALTSCSTALNAPSSVFDSLNFRKCDWIALREAIIEIEWSPNLGSISTEQCFTEFVDTITKTCSEIIPLSKPSRRRISKFFRERKIMMKKRTKQRKRYEISADSSTKAIINSIEREILSSHSNEQIHDEAIAVSKIKIDPNYFFRYAKKFSIVRQEIGPLCLENGQLTSDKLIMCGLLLKQFTSVFSTPIPDKVVSDPSSFFSVPLPITEAQITDITITQQIILDSISEISANSAAGPDGFQSSIFKNCAQELSGPLVLLFKSSLETGIIPSQLKRAAIVPVYKGGDKSLPVNYRPISLTSILMKIFERIIRKQIVAFLTREGLFNPTQHGFREGRSCLSALLSVYDDLLHSFTALPPVWT